MACAPAANLFLDRIDGVVVVALRKARGNTKHDDAAIRDAGERLAKAAKQRTGRSD